MAVCMMRGLAPPDALHLALDPDRDYNVPMAPELGLFLVSGKQHLDDDVCCMPGAADGVCCERMCILPY